MSARIQSSERVRVSASRRLSSDPCWVTPWHLPDELARAGQHPWAGVPGPRSPRHRLAGQLPFQQCSPDPPGYRLLSGPSGAPASPGCTPSTSRTRAAGGARSPRRRSWRGRGRARGADRSSLPEPLRWDAERPVEARGRVLPRDDHRQLRDGVVVVVPLHAREQLVVDVLARVRDRVGVFERHLLRVAEERALRVVVERLELLRRDAEPAAHGSIHVLSEFAAVPRGDASVEQRPERTGHALRLLLEGGPHRLGGPEERRVARVEEVRIERRAPELALFL